MSVNWKRTGFAERRLVLTTGWYVARTTQGSAWRSIDRPPWRPWRRKLAKGRRPARTWGPAGSGPRLERIDDALVSGLRVVSAQTVHLAGSDHLAVVADLVDDQ